jgi:hypothetical protein
MRAPPLSDRRAALRAKVSRVGIIRRFFQRESEVGGRFVDRELNLTRVGP